VNIHYATLETRSTTTDTAVVIDVIRAFTTAAFAFAAGARDIIPVNTVKEALTLRERFPGALVMGCDRDRVPPEGFDFGNSPAALIGRDLHGKRIIQYTTNGTRGVVRSDGAKTLLASSFVCARATAEYIRRLSLTEVTFVITGAESEDRECAKYIAGLLGDEMPNVANLLEELRNFWLCRIRADVAAGGITAEVGAGFEADLECCTSLDRFNFAMVVRRQEGLPVMEAVFQPAGGVATFNGTLRSTDE
jgi:2-phosphosulfolactate phosphatase